MIVGAPAGYQTLSLQDLTGATICTLEDNDAMLGAYPVEDFLTLWVEDGNPHGSYVTNLCRATYRSLPCALHLAPCPVPQFRGACCAFT
jgi:hypothetical protein